MLDLAIVTSVVASANRPPIAPTQMIVSLCFSCMTASVPKTVLNRPNEYFLKIIIDTLILQ